MKILFLTNLPSPYRVDFFNQLVRCGIDVTVLFERNKAQNRTTKWRSEEEILFQEVYLKSIKIGDESSLALDAIKYIKKKEYDLIVIGGYSTITSMICIEYMRLKNIPFILNADGGKISQDSWIKNRIKKHFIGAASAWLSSGFVATNYFVHYGANRDKVYEYPFSSIKNADIEKPLNEADKEKLRKKLNVKERFVVLSVGRFSYDRGYGKGFDVLLKIASVLKNLDIAFVIVGDEPTREFVELKEKNGLDNVYYIGFKSKSELADYYRMSDLFILMTRGDVWGLVINEAMSYGLPIISSDKCVAGLELVDDNNGFIVNPEDFLQASKDIQLLYNDKSLLKKFSESSLKKISKYTIENMAKVHFDIFSKLIKAQR